MSASTRDIASQVSLVSGGLFLISLAMPSVCTTHDCHWGLFLLFLGWAGIFDGHYAWYANLPLALSFVLIQSKRGPMLLSVLASAGGLLMALSAFSVTEIWNDSGNDQVSQFGPGAYIWIFSFIASFVASANRAYEQTLASGRLTSRLKPLLLIALLAIGATPFVAASKLGYFKPQGARGLGQPLTACQSICAELQRRVQIVNSGGGSLAELSRLASDPGDCKCKHPARSGAR